MAGRFSRKTETDAVGSSAATAQATANTAVANAAAAQSTANGAATAASNAQTTANSAVTAAGNAQATANSKASMADIAASKYLDQNGGKDSVVLLGTNDYTGVLAPAITSYSHGMRIRIYPANGNTGASTLNINGVGVRPIQKSGGDLTAGDLPATQWQDLTYSTAANAWQLTTAIYNKLNTGENAVLAGDEGGVGLLSAAGRIIRSTIRFIAATRELIIGATGLPGKITVWSNVFKLSIQDNIGDGQASIVMNNLQDKALQFIDKAGNVYMIFRTLATGAGVVISKLWIFDQGISMPLYRAQAAATSAGAGVKVYGTKGDVNNTQFFIAMNTDTLVCALSFRIKMFDATGSKIIHATWAGTLKRIAGVISIAGTPDLKTLSDNGTSGFTYGVEAKSDNSGILLWFTPGGSDTTPYTGGFYNIEYNF